MLLIKTYAQGDSIHVAISDTGYGIPPDKISKIFEPFYTTKEVGKGTGLGLSIAYNIIKKHNGEINIKSKVGKGTTFIISIPVVE
jgi:signal transduction histidine kinase